MDALSLLRRVSFLTPSGKCSFALAADHRLVPERPSYSRKVMFPVFRALAVFGEWLCADFDWLFGLALVGFVEAFALVSFADGPGWC